MSKQTVDTDADRAARATATITVGKDAHGQPSKALLAFDPKCAPSGAFVEVALTFQLKKGWRWATKEEVRNYKNASAA